MGTAVTAVVSTASTPAAASAVSIVPENSRKARKAQKASTTPTAPTAPTAPSISPTAPPTVADVADQWRRYLIDRGYRPYHVARTPIPPSTVDLACAGGLALGPEPKGPSVTPLPYGSSPTWYDVATRAAVIGRWWWKHVSVPDNADDAWAAREEDVRATLHADERRPKRSKQGQGSCPHCRMPWPWCDGPFRARCIVNAAEISARRQGLVPLRDDFFVNAFTGIIARRLGMEPSPVGLSVQPHPFTVDTVHLATVTGWWMPRDVANILSTTSPDQSVDEIERAVTVCASLLVGAHADHEGIAQWTTLRSLQRL